MALTSSITIDVMRLKKLFQHEDNALTTSPCVEVALVHSLVEQLDEDTRAAYVRTTRAAREEESPFLNESFTFDTSFIVKALPLTELGLAGSTDDAPSMMLGRPPKDYGASIRLARSEQNGGGNPVEGGDANDASASSEAIGIEKHVKIRLRALDTNKSPSDEVAECFISGISVVEAAPKKEQTLTLVRSDNPPMDDAGTLTVRVAVNVTKPDAPVADPDADIVLPYEPRFSGDYQLVPEDRLDVCWHLANDAAWRDRVIKAAIAAFPPEKAAGMGKSVRGGKAANLNASMKRAGSTLNASTRGSAAADGGGDGEGSGLVAVVRDRWKCRRLHQIFTKFRFACERQMTGVSPLEWTADDELVQKALWVDSAAVRRLAMKASKKVPAALERAWLLYLTGEAPQETSGTVSFEHRTKMSTASFNRGAYEALVAAIIEMMLPPLAGSGVVALIAKETYEADASIPGTRAFKVAAAAKAAEPADTKPAAEPTSPLKAGDGDAAPAPAPPAKARPGEAAFDAFKSVVTYYADWWCESYTEAEYIAQLRALDQTLLLAKQKVDAASSSAGVGLLGSSMGASGKRKGTIAPKKKKKKG